MAGPGRRFCVLVVLAVAVASAPTAGHATTTAAATFGTIVTAAGGPVSGPATAIGMAPRSVAFGGGGLYVVDSALPNVRRIDLGTGDARVVAGAGGLGSSDTGSALTSLMGVAAIAVDATGRLVVSDYMSYSVRVVSPSGGITTLAGADPGGVSTGDGGPARAASIEMPAGVAIDGDGAVFVATRTRIRKVDSEGTITTVAGGGTVAGQAADGGPATAAKLEWVEGLALGPDGSVYFSEYLDGTLRRVTPDGVLTTVASELDYPQGIATDAVGRVYVTEPFAHRLVRIDLNGSRHVVAGNGTQGSAGDGGLAVEAELDQPSGVAVDPVTGSIAIADPTGYRARLVSASGIITTVAGNGTPAFSGDGGPATGAQLLRPDGVLAAPDGSVFVADTYLHRVRRITPNGLISTVAGNGTAGSGGDGGPATAAQLVDPTGLALDGSGALYIADRGSDRVRRVSPNGVITTVAGSGNATGDGGPATAARLDDPLGVAIDRLGALYVTEYTGHRVRKVLPIGIITTLAGTGVRGLSGDGGFATVAALDHPAGVAVDRLGNVFFADFYNSRVRVVSPLGIITTYLDEAGTARKPGASFGTGFHGAYGVALDPNGHLLATSADTGRVVRVLDDGSVERLAGCCNPGFSGDGGRSTDAQLGFTTGVAVSNDGTLWIADPWNNRIRKVTGIPVPPGSALNLTPSLPLNVTANPGNGYLTARWVAPAIDAGSPVTGYSVIASTAGRVIAWQSVPADTRAVSVPGLVNDTVYDVQVFAINANGWSASSTVVHATPTSTAPAPTVPAKPTITAVVVGSEFITARWVAPADNGSPVTAFSLIAIETATGRVAGWINLAADVRAASVGGLHNGVTYDIAVAAWSAKGIGAPAVVPTVAPAAVGPPVAPPGPPAQIMVRQPVGTNRLTVSWLPTEFDNGAPITGYTIVAVQRGRPIGWLNVGANARSATVNSVERSYPVTVYVLATNRLGATTGATPATIFPAS